jgi:hypothetical protein
MELGSVVMTRFLIERHLRRFGKRPKMKKAEKNEGESSKVESEK